MIGIDFESIVSKIFLTALFQDSEEGQAMRNHYQIDERLYEQVRNLKISDWSDASHAIVEVVINQDALALNLQRLATYKERLKNEDKAIKLGASRQNMNELCSMTEKEFSLRLKQLGLQGRSRKKPELLTDQDINQLNDLYEGQSLAKKRTKLEKIVSLSESSGISFNRIVQYYVKENEGVF